MHARRALDRIPKELHRRCDGLDRRIDGCACGRPERLAAIGDKVIRQIRERSRVRLLIPRLIAFNLVRRRLEWRNGRQPNHLDPFRDHRAEAHHTILRRAHHALHATLLIEGL